MPPRTFSIQTLGCRVNQYEAEQLAALLRSRGLLPAAAGPGDPPADLRLVHTCSVTVQAAGKSRQTARRSVVSLPILTTQPEDSPTTALDTPDQTGAPTGRVILTGCWATSDPASARAIPGVDAVITHHDDVASEIDRLLRDWGIAARSAVSDQSLELSSVPATGVGHAIVTTGVGTFIDPHTAAQTADVGPAGGDLTTANRPHVLAPVNGKIAVARAAAVSPATPTRKSGFSTLPLLGDHQTGRQRALLKIQDGCDAHCTYCIIPQLRSELWSKDVDDAVEEARRLVDAGHVELVLTGIFLGAYGQSTALRRRQPAGRSPLASLVDALCTQVPGLRRLRLSSLEPGDLGGDLLSALAAHPQVVPHFHLPLQSGSDRLLRKMNRQYTRGDFLQMAEQVKDAFNRPALTTDVIAGFPGEDDAAFAETADVVREVGFIHVHAFHFSPRPRTAAARWQKDFVRGPVVGERVEMLRRIADDHSLAFRRSFLGQEVELLVERDRAADTDPSLHHGRCERYFDVWFEDATARPGDFVRVRIDQVTPTRTQGSRQTVLF